MSAEGLHIVDPRGVVPTTVATSLASRPGRQSAPRIGFLINEVNRGAGPDFTTYSESIERELVRRDPRTTVTREWKPVLSRPATVDMLDRLRTCSGVVTGLAK